MYVVLLARTFSKVAGRVPSLCPTTDGHLRCSSRSLVVRVCLVSSDKRAPFHRGVCIISFLREILIAKMFQLLLIYRINNPASTAVVHTETLNDAPRRVPTCDQVATKRWHPMVIHRILSPRQFLLRYTYLADVPISEHLV